MTAIFEQLMNWIRPKKQPSSTVTTQLLQTLAMTREDELSCDEIYSLLDQFVELKIRGDDVEKLMPMVKHHLDMCRDCFEEYESLIAALEFEKTM